MPNKGHNFFCKNCLQEVTGTTKQHNASVYHRQNRRIRALLKKPCISYLEIGRRIGVSHEMVRLIYNRMQLDQTGAERHTACIVARGPYPLREGCLALQIQKVCQERGLCFDFVPIKFGRHRQRFSTKFVNINGHICLLTESYRRQNGVIILHRVKVEAEFRLTRLYDGRWMIIPRDKWPEKQTGFKENPKPNLGAHSVRHDWQSYIEAWDLLK